jgi:hypothetical protein
VPRGTAGSPGPSGRDRQLTAPARGPRRRAETTPGTTVGRSGPRAVRAQASGSQSHGRWRPRHARRRAPAAADGRGDYALGHLAVDRVRPCEGHLASRTTVHFLRLLYPRYVAHARQGAPSSRSSASLAGGSRHARLRAPVRWRVMELDELRWVCLDRRGGRRPRGSGCAVSPRSAGDRGVDTLINEARIKSQGCWFTPNTRAWLRLFASRSDCQARCP